MEEVGASIGHLRSRPTEEAARRLLDDPKDASIVLAASQMKATALLFATLDP
jgi:hypothetical protein